MPAVVRERDDEAQQIRDERDDPEQRYRRNVLTEMIGDRGQQERSAGRERDPERESLARQPAFAAASAGLSGTLGCSRYAPPTATMRPRNRAADHGEHDEPDRQRQRLAMQRHARLDEPRIDQQRHQRSNVRDREQAVWLRRAATASPTAGRRRPGVPRLQEWTRGRQRHERHADQDVQQPQDARDWMAGVGTRARVDGERRAVQATARAASRTTSACNRAPGEPGQPVRGRVADEQRALKEHEARRPHRCRSAEQREQTLGGDRLEQKEQGTAEEDGDRVPDAGRGRAGKGFHARRVHPRPRFSHSRFFVLDAAPGRR